MKVAYWGVCLMTGLLVGVCFWQMFHPTSILRVLIYGGLGVGVGMLGLILCDRLRPPFPRER